MSGEGERERGREGGKEREKETERERDREGRTRVTQRLPRKRTGRGLAAQLEQCCKKGPTPLGGLQTKTLEP